MFGKILAFTLGAIGLLAVGLGVAYVVTGPITPDASSPSASWLKPGRFAVGQAEFPFVDETRPTAANNDFQGSTDRKLPTTVMRQAVSKPGLS